MSTGEILQHLFTWTPFLLGGFALNILISLLTVALGTALGLLFASARLSERPRVRRLAEIGTAFFRNIPTLAFVFYAALVIPNEFYWPLTKELVAFPAWLKASIALAVGQLGYQSDQFFSAIQSWRKGLRDAAMLVVPNWFSGFLMTVLASSTASLVGVGELVSRSNTVINVSNTQLMIPVYLYASLIFLVFCLPMSWVFQIFRKRLLQRIGSSGSPFR